MEGMYVADYTTHDTLRPLGAWELTPDGHINVSDQVRELCFCYEGSLTCCARNHERDGQPIRCDKRRVANALVGLYGHVLQTVVAESTWCCAQENAAPPNSSLGQETSVRHGWAVHRKKAQAILALAQSGRVFPREYFGTSIQAMQEHLSASEDNSKEHTRNVNVGLSRLFDVRDLGMWQQSGTLH